MIVKRWGKYRALEDFADVKKDDVIDVTGVMEGPHEIMWASNGRISDWHDWDIPVVGPQTTISTQNDNERRVKSLLRKSLVADARELKPSAVAIIALLKERAAAGEAGAIEALEELRVEYQKADNRPQITDNGPECKLSIIKQRDSAITISGSDSLSHDCDIVFQVQSDSSLADARSPTASHPKCVMCSHSAGWDSSGLGFCTQPLGISSLFDEHARFPITDEQYCSNHSEVKRDNRLQTSDAREKE